MTKTSIEQARILFESILKNHLTAEIWQWLSAAVKDSSALTATFTRIPRKTGKTLITIPKDNQRTPGEFKESGVENWTVDKLARVWLLMTFEEKDEFAYINQVEKLFEGAEVNELVALYTALQYLSFPEHWATKCAEGIRSNIGDVLQAIMCNNPYPAAWLKESAWNQMVLKAFFTEKPIHLVIGLDARANRELAKALSYYSHERWAAARTVNPQLWRCVGPFIDEQIFPDIIKISASENIQEREAAALACNSSSYTPAKELLARMPAMKHAIDTGELTWDTFAEKLPANKN